MHNIITILKNMWKDNHHGVSSVIWVVELLLTLYSYFTYLYYLICIYIMYNIFYHIYIYISFKLRKQIMHLVKRFNY